MHCVCVCMFVLRCGFVGVFQLCFSFVIVCKIVYNTFSVSAQCVLCCVLSVWVCIIIVYKLCRMHCVSVGDCLVLCCVVML